jgi:hypothetical protein
MLGAVMTVRCMVVVCGVALAAPRAAADDAILVFDGSASRVAVDGKAEERWEDAERTRLRIRRKGLRKVEVTFVRKGEPYRATRYIALGPGVEVKLWDHNGPRIAAQPAGKRCARVDGSRRSWRLCDGDEHQKIPVGEVFDLANACPNPADLGEDHNFWLAPRTPRGASIASPAFVPTLPGLYRARLRGGRIVVTHEPSDCAAARPLPDV